MMMMMMMNQIVHCIATCNEHLILQLQWRLAWTFKWMHCVFAAFSFSSFRSIIFICKHTHTHTRITRSKLYIRTDAIWPRSSSIPAHLILYSIWFRPIAINYGNLISLWLNSFFLFYVLFVCVCVFFCFATFVRPAHIRAFCSFSRGSFSSFFSFALLVFIFIIIIIIVGIAACCCRRCCRHHHSLACASCFYCFVSNF